VTSTIHKKF
jgi:integrase